MPAGHQLLILERNIILIVEDDFTRLSLLTEFLSKFEECHANKDGPEAGADSYMAKPVDLIQLKRQMQSMNLID
ncbi:MAG: hypothetical protein KKF30_16750 [Proteobacteria bacterium]|nr:hypothetical protein [Pseudomonadota bacterium]MBU4469587.1 hypothetical protein [Pseudomonadota bacterium]MCG2753265.1 hypothetical protein [Desulfobacteraceae bacterium]